VRGEEREEEVMVEGGGWHGYTFVSIQVQRRSKAVAWHEVHGNSWFVFYPGLWVGRQPPAQASPLS